MLISQRVNNFLSERRPGQYCDDCIADNLRLKRRQQAQRVTSALGTTADFDRTLGVCSMCVNRKLVTRRA